MAKMQVNSVAMDARLESAYGAGASVQATTTFDSANLLFRNRTPFNVDTQEVDFDPLQTDFTDRGTAIGRQLSDLTPGLNLQSYGTSIAAYRLDVIFRICGMARTTTSGTAIYKFRSDGFESGDLTFFEQAISGNGLRHRVVGAYGNLVMAGSFGQAITIEPSFKGTYTAAVGAAVPTLSLPAQNVNTMKAAGCTITVAGGSPITPIGKSFSWDWGWPINEDGDFNAPNGLAGLLMGRRRPTLSLVLGLDSITFLEFQDARDAAKRLTTVLTHTDTDGGKVRLTLTSQIRRLTKGEDNEYGTITLDTKLTNATANEEAMIQVWKP